MRWVGLTLPLVLGACEGKRVTELVIHVSTDLSIPEEMSHLGFRAEDVAEPTRRVGHTWQVGEPAEISMPHLIALLPGGDPQRRIEISVSAWVGDDLRVEQRAAVAFVRDRVLLVQMHLLRRCVGQTCNTGETCGLRHCEPARRDAAQLPEYAPGAEVLALDAGPDVTPTPAEDAGPAPSCDELYGAAESYEPCSETPGTCTFFVSEADGAKRPCSHTCAMYGQTCANGWDNASGEDCVPDGPSSCQDPHEGKICECTR